MIKLKILGIMVFILLGVSIYKLSKAYIQSKKDNNRLLENMALINQDLEYHKSKSGKLFAQNMVLIYRNREFRIAFPKLTKELKDLKLKPKRVASITTSTVESKKQIVTILRDSFIRDTLFAKVFNYHDEFYKVKGIAFNDTQKVEIQSIDSIIQVVYRGKRKRPYLWIFSKRQLEQVITCKNPNSKINYSKHIEFQNNKLK